MTWIDTPKRSAIPLALKKNSTAVQTKADEISAELTGLVGPSAQAATHSPNPFAQRPPAGLVQPVLPHEPRRDHGIGEASMKNQTNQKGMAGVMALAKRYAEGGDGAIILRGETGGGKSHVAEQLAKWTGRKGPFVTVCCGAIPHTLIESQLFGHMRGAFSGAVSNFAGAFKQADGGVIFLDEVGELPLDMQVKLLRVTQDGTFRPVGGSVDVTVDVRIISATNQDLGALVKAGKFRADLMFRLEALPVVIPPLRERRGEIKGLVEAALERRGWVLGDGVLEVFEYAEWPGNIRELLNTVQRAALGGWTAKDAARELRASAASNAPEASRLGRLGIARDLSERGWWSAAELCLATGVSRATALRDLAEWVDAGLVKVTGNTNTRRYLNSDHSNHEESEESRVEQKTDGEVVK